MERKNALILGTILFAIGIVLAVVAFMSYLGGILSGPIATALRSNFLGPTAATLLIIVGGLILMFSTRGKEKDEITEM
jgi:hypothetical protein